MKMISKNTKQKYKRIKDIKNNIKIFNEKKNK